MMLINYGCPHGIKFQDFTDDFHDARKWYLQRDSLRARGNVAIIILVLVVG